VICILRAIADETRFKLLKHLEAGELCACKLPELVGESQPNVSKHLRVLRSAGLVMVKKDGNKRIYSLSGKGRQILRDISRW